MAAPHVLGQYAWKPSECEPSGQLATHDPPLNTGGLAQMSANESVTLAYALPAANWKPLS